MEHECDDEELIDEACRGSEQAFRRLVECNQDKLFAFMLKMLGCREDAEEAVQEAFARAFLRINDFNRNSKFSTWLYRIAFNSAVSDRRKQRPKISLDQRLEDFGNEAMDDADEVDAGMLRDEKVALVHRALDGLSDDLDQYSCYARWTTSHTKRSPVLNISTGTVRSRLSRARDRLRESVNATKTNVANAGWSDD